MKELSSEEFAEWRRIITDVLREFHDLCHKHGLTYYAVGGTAIGAVRHKGLIPWDDDIDVAMPRPDYDRFVDICKTEELGGYELASVETHEGYNLSFVKFCNKKTTLVERWDTPCVIGLYIDVFALDSTSDDPKEMKILVEKCRKYRNRLEAVSTHNSYGEYMSLLLTPHEWGRFVMKTLGFLARKRIRKFLLDSIDRICRKFPYGSTHSLINYGGAYGVREVFSADILKGEPKNLPFEDITIDMMPDYDRYLRGVYGDYMQLPPEDKRVPHHQKAFYDMKARVDVKMQ